MQLDLPDQQYNSQSESYTLGKALLLYRTSEAFKTVGVRFMKNLNIALKLYILPEYLTGQELNTGEFNDLCNEIPISNLQNALEVFDRRFTETVERGETALSTGKNYRSALRRFLNWMEQQVWWQCLSYEFDELIAPSNVRVPKKPGTGGELSLYGLSITDLHHSLFREIQEFKDFRLTGKKVTREDTLQNKARETRARRPKVVTVKLSTFEGEQQRILRFLGWFVEYHWLKDEKIGYLESLVDLLSEVSLSGLTYYKIGFLSSPYFNYVFNLREQLFSDLKLELLTDIELLDEYVYWVIDTRGVSFATAQHFGNTSIAIAKWLTYEKSVRRNWSDIHLIIELQDLRNEYSEDYKEQKKQTRLNKWAAKKLSHNELEKVVDYLHKCCAPYVSRDERIKSPNKRSLATITRLWQTYLFIKILVYCPVRQEEIRGYVLGKTLFRKEDADGQPYYEAYLQEHKRDGTSEARHYKLPNILTKDLDLWVYKWRPLIQEMIRTEENWVSFWGHSYEKVHTLRQRIRSAKEEGVSNTRVKDPQKHIQRLERILAGIERRVAGWQTGKSNFEEYDHVFFMFGKRGIEAFGRPFSRDNFWEVVTKAIAKATQALFGEPRWTNPHALRNIAEKHIRKLGKGDITEAFGVFIGHSEKMGDEYAEQLTSDYELSENITDNWWMEEG